MPSLARRAAASTAVAGLLALGTLAAPTPSGAATTVTVKLPHAVCKAPRPHHRSC